MEFHHYNAKYVAYFSKELMKIQVLNIVDNKLSDLFDHCNLPTFTALPENERQDIGKIYHFKYFTKIAILPQSKSIVVMEPKFQNEGFN
jgi:hypothetical protein